MNEMRSQLLLTVFLWLLIASFAHGQKAPAGYSQADYERGRADAKSDITRGILVYEFAGLPAPTDDEETRILRERYHIELRRVAGDEIRIDAISHMIGYNEISLPEIERRFGKGILEKVDAEVKANYEKRQ
ncbi:MAG: hypothetical protein JO170_28775 [Verrucomicrobia bacterium]|nr:hypothetical protein [Verrucomicrobiota bacterium]